MDDFSDLVNFTIENKTTNETNQIINNICFNQEKEKEVSVSQYILFIIMF